MKDLIPLQSCHITQHTSGATRTAWNIEENITNRTLGTLPNHLSEGEVFAIIAFAREYELEALNVGIRFQKDKNNEYLMSQIAELKGTLRQVLVENEKLADALDTKLEG